MSDQFAMGTICIGQGFIRAADNNGKECEIIGGLEMRRWGFTPAGESIRELCYKVRWVDGIRSNEKPIHLRRKPPKQSDKGERRIMELFVPVEQPEMVPR